MNSADVPSTERPAPRGENLTFRAPAFVAIAALVVLSLTGCVQRRLLIQSQPEGAFVSIDKQPVGYTPVAVPYTYHGTREIQLEKDGYKVIRVQQRIRPNWYDRFPVSLVTNNFWGREVRDERLFDFQLEPKTQPNENLLLDRANELRGNIQRGTVTAPIR
ncbi:MAG: PEGA domain-containing protein [Planctomycetota bacterium]